jgi:hypothetical protein
MTEFLKISPLLLNRSIKMNQIEINNTCDVIKSACKGFNDDTSLINTIGSIPVSSVQQIKNTFQQKFGTDIIKFLEKEVSGDYGKLLKGLLEAEAGEAAAREINKLLSGVFKGYTGLIELLIGRSNYEQKLINDAYYNLFSRYLVDDINKNMSGNVRKLLESQVNCERDESGNNVSVPEDIQALYKAGKGLFTDDGPFIYIFSKRSFGHLQKVMQEFQQYHHKSFIDFLEGEFSGNTETFFVNYAKHIANPALHFAQLLDDAMKGIGTDDSSLVRLVLRLRGNGMMAAVRKCYKDYCNHSLEERINKETSGDFRTLLLKVVHESSSKGFQNGNYQPQNNSNMKPSQNSPVANYVPQSGPSGVQMGQPQAGYYTQPVYQTQPQGYAPQAVHNQAFVPQGFAPGNFQQMYPQQVFVQGNVQQGYPQQGYQQPFPPQGYGFPAQGYVPPRNQ